MNKPKLKYYSFEQAADYLSDISDEKYNSNYIYSLARENHLITCFKSIKEDRHRYIPACEVEELKLASDKIGEPTSYDNLNDAYFFSEPNLSDIGWEKVNFDDLLIPCSELERFAILTRKEKNTSYFDNTYWNLLQLLSWAHLRDRAIVHKASDDYVDPITDRKLDIISAIHQQKGKAIFYESPSEAQNAVLKELQAGKIEAFGIANNIGDLQKIEDILWANLKFYFEPNIAAPEKFMVKTGATQWHNLKFKQEDILKVWHNIECEEATPPPEKIPNEDLKAFLLHDTLKENEAIYLFNGKNPRTVPNWFEDLQTHFPNELSYFIRSAQEGRFGEKKIVDGQEHYTATPKEWADWFQKRELPIEKRVINLLGLPKSKTPKTSLANAETECEALLIEYMKSGPQVENKKYYQNEATDKFQISVRGFKDRAWPNAIRNSGNPHKWGAPGPKKK